MGVDISAFKLKKFLGEKYTDKIEDKYPEARMIFVLDFKPDTNAIFKGEKIWQEI
jgi:hypothetical protein